MGWLYENTWCIGIIYLVFGPLIALFGGKWFSYITATLVALFTMTFSCNIALSAGWMVSVGGSVATLTVSLVLGIIAGCLVRRQFKVMLCLVGMVAGFFGGTFLFALISGMTGGSWNAVWGFWVLACTCAIVGALLACWFGMPLVLVCTSMIGSYLFMRSWTLFFPGSYPSEESLIESKGADALEMDALFWMYVGIFIVSFIVSLTFQCKLSKQDEELEHHFQKQHA